MACRLQIFRDIYVLLHCPCIMSIKVQIDWILIIVNRTLHCSHYNMSLNLHIIFRSPNFIIFPHGLIPKHPKLLLSSPIKILNVFLIFFTDCRGKMGSTPVAYSGGTRFRSCTGFGNPDRRVSWFSSLHQTKVGLISHPST